MLVHLEYQRTGIPMAEVGNSGGVAEPAQRSRFGVGVDGLAEGFRHRVVNGLDRPLSGDVDRFEGAGVVTGSHHHRRPVGGDRRVLDQLLAAVDPHSVVGMCLIRLQQGELRVVAEVHTLVAESPAEFEYPLHPSNAEPLEVKLRGDPQVQVEIVGVDVGLKRPGVGTTVDLLQYRGLDLQETLGEQRFPDRAQDVAARPDEITSHRINREVDVAGAHPGLRVGQALPLVRQWPQAFAQQAPPLDEHRTGAIAAVPDHAGRLDQIAEVDVAEVLRGVFDPRPLQQ